MIACMSAFFLTFLRREDGGTAIEYALIAAGLAAAACAVFALIQPANLDGVAIVANALSPASGAGDAGTSMFNR